jgi:hypothetical protein
VFSFACNMLEQVRKRTSRMKSGKTFLIHFIVNPPKNIVIKPCCCMG